MVGEAEEVLGRGEPSPRRRKRDSELLRHRGRGPAGEVGHSPGTGVSRELVEEDMVGHEAACWTQGTQPITGRDKGASPPNTQDSSVV